MGMATDGAYIYVTNNNSDTVTKLRESNGVRLSATYKVGDGPFGIAFDGAYIWVANFGDGNVMKLALTGHCRAPTGSATAPSRPSTKTASSTSSTTAATA